MKSNISEVLEPVEKLHNVMKSIRPSFLPEPPGVKTIEKAVGRAIDEVKLQEVKKPTKAGQVIEIRKPVDLKAPPTFFKELDAKTKRDVQAGKVKPPTGKPTSGRPAVEPRDEPVRPRPSTRPPDLKDEPRRTDPPGRAAERQAGSSRRPGEGEAEGRTSPDRPPGSNRRETSRLPRPTPGPHPNGGDYTLPKAGKKDPAKDQPAKEDGSKKPSKGKGDKGDKDKDKEDDEKGKHKGLKARD